MTPPTPLRALIIEDDENDALLLADSLISGGYALSWRRVDSEAALCDALQHPWDIVFSDYSMPGFSGTQALAIFRRHNRRGVPFIFVSGTIGEDAAVAAMKAGAQDYVMKGSTKRLLPAVERELREASAKRARRAAEAGRQRLAEILEATPDIVFIVQPTHKLAYLNRSGYQQLGLPAGSSVRGKTIAECLPEGLQRLLQQAVSDVLRDGLWSGEASFIDHHGQQVPLSVVMIAHRNHLQQVQYLSVIARDISERKRFETELQHQATHDGLTRLPNRFLLLDRFQSALQHARRSNSLVATLFIDLDNFKRVNDSLGHHMGDMFLTKIAERLTHCLRPRDTVARHGGDEFTIILTDLICADDIMTVIQKLRSEFAKPIFLGEDEVYATFSIGIAVYPGDGHSPDDLLRHADTAMYRAKRTGSNQYCFYAPDMNARSHESLTLEAELRHAIDHAEFNLHYQPQVALNSGRIVGLEALIRWQHPRRGLVPPGDFIGLLERSGLIIPVGEWILRQACEQHRLLRQLNRQDVRISVNVSTLQFADKHFVDMVRTTLEEHQMPADKLELEITESQLMQDPDSAVSKLKRLKNMGVRTAIDDFGTGYSSLSYLKKFPIHLLKIDQTFVRDLDKSRADSAIVEASITLAQKFDLEIVAEGVETRSQLHFLRERECGIGQGYFLSRPLPSEHLIPLLTERMRLV